MLTLVARLGATTFCGVPTQLVHLSPIHRLLSSSFLSSNRFVGIAAVIICKDMSLREGVKKILVFLNCRVIQRDCRLYIFFDKPKIFKKCNNSMIFRELIYGGFGILFQKCLVCEILPIKAFQK